MWILVFVKISEGNTVTISHPSIGLNGSRGVIAIRRDGISAFYLRISAVV